ncbi:MAG: hypothetical protein HC801_06465, partial [Nitrospira sp.]|nr:hypothetical protein [Nitrospira sp.]
MRDQVGLAYLFARAADTIADTELIDRPRRLGFLNRLRAQFLDGHVDWDQIRAIQQAVGPVLHDSANVAYLSGWMSAFNFFLPVHRRIGAGSRVS